jgi:general stress protein 26
MAAETVDTGRLWGMIRGFRLGMLTLRGHDGQLHSSPMTTQNGASDRGGVLWFFMSRSGERIRANVAYADPDADRYVSVSGVARIVEDPAKKRELFAAGADDPDLALVGVVVREAEYWDVKSGKAVQLLRLAEHRGVRLH